MRVPRWKIMDSNGVAHIVEVAQPNVRSGFARSFTCDGRTYSLGSLIQRAPRLATFEVAGRQASMTMRPVLPRAGLRFRRAIGGSLRPAAILAFLFGSGAGGGAAAASAAGTMFSWTIYSLTVERVDQGSWVYRSDEGLHQDPIFVAPGGSLPDGNTVDWP
jgi:hypothetical protein